MLIDVAGYARDNLEARLMKRVTTVAGHDQRAINFVLGGRWTELSPAFNTTPICYLSNIAATFPPIISHFQGTAKPWHGPLFYLHHQARGEIEAFFADSPWASFIPNQLAARGWRPGIKVNYPGYTPPQRFTAAANAYMAETKFADVDQGVTSPHFLAL
jgi:lipopolysaccharide biosynthesis glycosyltransferase